MKTLHRFLAANPLCVAILASLPRTGRASAHARDVATDVQQCDGIECSEKEVRTASHRIRAWGVDVTCSEKHGLMRWRPTVPQLYIVSDLFSVNMSKRIAAA